MSPNRSLLSLSENLVEGGRRLKDKLWRSDSSNQILLLAYNRLMAEYVNRYKNLLPPDVIDQCVFARPPFADRSIRTKDIQSILGVRRIPFHKALFEKFRLVLTPDHYPCGLLSPKAAKVFVSHGIFNGRIFDTGNYIYGTRAHTEASKPRYEVMLASGEFEKAYVIKHSPALQDCIRVVGDVPCDELLALQPKREELRLKAGLSNERPVLVIISTWGAESLIWRWGCELEDEAAELLKQFQIIMTVHPNNFTRNGHQTISRRVEHLVSLGVTFIPTQGDWQELITLADIVLSDYTSLSLYYSVLKRPLVFVPFPLEGRFLEESPIYKLREITPLVGEKGIVDAVRKAYEQPQLDSLLDFSSKLVSHQGRSTEKVQQVLSEFLN